ncbi:MAG: ATP-binding protein, partial [Planctomycetes bacterium]|nr:ATP-binding protein [Planctomycetota bacterium]
QQLCLGRRAAYFLAAQVRDKDNLRAFRKVLEEALGDPLIGSIEFPDWTAALSFAAERAGSERLVLVLDEFPYLCEANPGLPSLIQRFWDLRGKRSSLMLVLCGSQVSFMEKEVLAERSPLFGRRTGQRRLEPLAPSESLGFFRTWKREVALLAYGIVGGMPAYLGRFDERVTLEENLLREMLRPEGYLFDEVHYLLHTELTNPSTYNSILAAVARGAERVGDVALAVGVDSPTANKYLHVLRELRLVAREVPLTDPDPLRSRRGVYRIADRFVAFHFRHVQPHISLIEAGRGARVLEEFIRPDFPRLAEEARGELLLERLRHDAAELVGEEIAEVGRHSGLAVRALARTVSGRGVAVLAAEASGPAVEKELEELRPALGTGLVQLVATRARRRGGAEPAADAALTRAAV